eukprot:scaffold198509_cov36-Tisochrysis_lutea.AAC.1
MESSSCQALVPAAVCASWYAGLSCIGLHVQVQVKRSAPSSLCCVRSRTVRSPQRACSIKGNDSEDEEGDRMLTKEGVNGRLRLLQAGAWPLLQTC